MPLSVISGLVGIAVGLCLAWFNGALGEAGRCWRADRHARQVAARNAKNLAADAACQLEARKQAKKEVLDAQAHAERQMANHRNQVRTGRVGQVVRWKAAAHDSGMIGRVTDLDPRAPDVRVLVEFENPPGRAPSPHDYPPYPISFEWRHLTLAAEDQRHRTARLIAKSFDDGDGWVEFELVPSGA